MVVCGVTGSTFAGMVASFKLLEKLHPNDPKRRVVGIDGSVTTDATRAQVLRIARNTASKIGLNANHATDADVILDDRYHAGASGIPDRQT